MKQLLCILFLSIVVFSCRKKDSYPTYAVTVQLTDTTGNNFTAASGVNVKLSASSGAVFEGNADATGKAIINVPAGIYNASATFTKSEGIQKVVYNGSSASTITVASNWDGSAITKIKMIQAQLSQVIIKELFTGGTPSDDGSAAFIHDKYMILYNNSETPADISKVCLAIISPYNAHATNNYIDAGGNLIYESEKWIPAVQGFWYFQKNVVLEPGAQIVIALGNAVNNSITYSRSVNFDNAAYFCTYDLLNFPNTNYYIPPAASIPTNQYLKSFKYATGNAWAISVTSPGVFLFAPKGGVSAESFAADAATTHVLNAPYTSKKVPFDWVIDGVEVFLLNNTANKKRFPAVIDAGSVYHTNRLGYSIYRNVDKKATEAIASNAGKLVYGYSLGTVTEGGTTDPSTIDAEASEKKGARIVYMDTNNSTADFHLRSKASLSAK